MYYLTQLQDICLYTVLGFPWSSHMSKIFSSIKIFTCFEGILLPKSQQSVCRGTIHGHLPDLQLCLMPLVNWKIQDMLLLFSSSFISIFRHIVTQLSAMLAHFKLVFHKKYDFVKITMVITITDHNISETNVKEMPIFTDDSSNSRIFLFIIFFSASAMVPLAK